MPTVLISGGTGLIGKALTRLLVARGYNVIILTRNPSALNSSYLLPASPEPKIQFAGWNIQSQTIDPLAVENADFIINLAGAGIAEKRWTRSRKKELCDSRVKSCELIAKALREIPNKVRTIISASAIGWYGADPEIPNPKPFTETAPADKGFLGETCRLWEESISRVGDLDRRLVILRTGIVLSSEGGALVEFEKPIRLGIAAILGSGKQVISWIHIDDLCRLYLEAIENENWQGVYNAVAPITVNNKNLVTGLAKLLKGKFFITFYIPSFILKFVLGEMSIEVLKSTTVSAAKIRQTGFQFLYPGIDAAIPRLKEDAANKLS
jgi:uncharacterized protein (TIGR01777 family)